MITVKPPNTGHFEILDTPNSGQKPDDWNDLLWNCYEKNFPDMISNSQHFSLEDRKIKPQLDNPNELEPQTTDRQR